MSLNHSQRATFSQSTLQMGSAFIRVRAVGQQRCLANHDFPKAAEAEPPGHPGSHVASRIPRPRKEHAASTGGHVCMKTWVPSGLSCGDRRLDRAVPVQCG